jgi:hypothetical protein
LIILFKEKVRIMEVKDAEGKLEQIGETKSKKGTKYWKIQISGRTYNWFNDADARKAFDELNVGDTVYVDYEENPNPQNENAPFKNIKSMKKVTQLNGENIPIEEIETEKEFFNGQEFGMVMNNAVAVCLENKLPLFDKNNNLDAEFEKLWAFSKKKRKEKGG